MKNEWEYNETVFNKDILPNLYDVTSKNKPLYNGNSVVFVAPGLMKYWTKTKAINDADRVLKDLRKMGY